MARLQKEATQWSDNTEILRRQIAERLKQDRYDVRTAPGRIAASAELNCLHRLGLNDGDEVVLLATDTADGRACAETLSKIIEKQWDGVQTIVERIEGLQVRDAKRLRDLGFSIARERCPARIGHAP